SRKHKVAGFCSEQGRGNRFEVAHFADEDDVWILTKSGAQGGGERRSVDFDFALIDEAFFVAVKIFDRVFNSDDVLGAERIDAIYYRGERCRSTGTGGAGRKNQAALLFANLGEDAREFELFNGTNLGWNDAQNHSDVAALLEYVDAEAPETGDPIGHVKFGGFLEFLLLPVGHHAEGHRQHFFGRDAGDVRQTTEDTVDAEVRVVADLEMQVGSPALHCSS